MNRTRIRCMLYKTKKAAFPFGRATFKTTEGYECSLLFDDLFRHAFVPLLNVQEVDSGRFVADVERLFLHAVEVLQHLFKNPFALGIEQADAGFT